jgi:hypothetical protein
METMSFQSVGNSVLRKTDYSIVSNKRVFSYSRGLGPYNIGSDEWVKGKEKKERIQHYL